MLQPSLPPILVPSPFADLEAAMGALLARTSDPLLQIGHNMLLAFAATLIAWYGIKTMLDTRLPSLAGITQLMVLVAFAFAMLRYYDTPLPGVGTSFPGLIVHQADYLSRLIEATAIQQVFETLDRTYQSLERPSAWAVFQGLIYLALAVVLGYAKYILLAVTAFGLVATAVCVLVGPLFIPFLIVPGFEWMFWGWLKAFVQFAFYRVVAQAVVWLLGSFVISFCQKFSDGLSLGEQVAYFVHFLMILGAFSMGVSQVPALTNALFSGRGGLTVPTERFFRW